MAKNDVINAIKKYKKFLVISHIGLEGDSLGSQLAFRDLLKGLGKESILVNEAQPPLQYDIFDEKNAIITDTTKEIDYEAVAILDCPVMKRIGDANKFLKEGRPVINIDHHISNTNFGDTNWVEPDASSCGEMVYKLFKEFDVAIDKRSALFLYAAILTDTGSFAYDNTTSKTHLIAAELLAKGLEPNRIHRALYENKTLDELELLKDALSTLRLSKDGMIASMFVSKEMLKTHKLTMDATEGMINYARSINGIKVAVIFLENPSQSDQIQISFRSKGEANVDKLAGLFGGGGHKNASGCVIKGELESVKNKVLDAIAKNI